MKLKLRLLEGEFTVHRFSPEAHLPAQIFNETFFSLSRTDEEISLVCRSEITLNAQKSEGGWSCLKVQGPLDFSLTGILAKISAALAQAEISIFALSTYNTDYILLKTARLPAARQALEKAGYVFEDY